MHLLYVTHGYKPAYQIGGPIWSVSAVAEEMARRGHRVTVFTTNSNLTTDLDVPPDRPIEVDGVEVWYFQHKDPLKKWLWWSKYWTQSVGFLFTPALKESLHRILPAVDLVHTQMPFVYPTMLAGRLALSAHKPLFYSQRGLYHPQRLGHRGLKKRLYLEMFEKPIMRGAHGLIALTPEEVDSYRALGISTPCHVVPNGIDVAKFRRTARRDALADIGIGESSQVILFLGRLHPSKGIDLLVSSFLQIASQFPDAVLVMAGPDEYGCAQQLASSAAQMGLQNRIVLTGVVYGDRKLDLLARADLFVLPSIGEGFSMAVLEALASGTPVILSPECNFPMVADAGAGLIVERKADLIAGAMSRLLSDRCLRKAAGERAFQLVGAEFDWKSIVDKLEYIYLDAIGVQQPCALAS